MDEPNPNKPAASGAPSDDEGTKISVNVNSSSSPAPGADPDAITPPPPGQVVKADTAEASSSDELNLADVQPLQSTESSTDPANTPAVEQPSSNPQPTITPAGMPRTDDPAAPTAPAAMAATETPPVSPGSPAQVVTSHHGGGKGRWIKIFLLLVVIALLAVGGWVAYNKHHKNKTPAASAQNKDIPLLRIGMRQADFGGIYPDISDNDYSVSVNSQMFDGLVRYQDRSKIVPDLASTWTNPDNNTWLFTIKKGVKFHDGNTLAPSDVKSSLDKMIASSSDFATTFAATIASVDLVGSNQVKITTKSPDPTLLNKLTLLYIIDTNAPKGSEPSLAGTGAYQVKPGTTPTNDNIQMVAFNGYHFGRPTTEALDFTNATDTGLMKDFNAGKYDMAGAVPPDQISQAKNATLFNVNEADSNYLAFNTVQPSPVQNKLVREAIRYAVNAGAIGKANGENLTPVSQLVPPSIPGYDPAISAYKQNIEKAKQLLAQAGYPNGVTLTLSVPTVNAKEAAEISNELKQVGITVNLDQHTDFDEFINYFTQGKAQMYVVDYASDTLDAADVYQTTLPESNYNNPKVNDLLAQANTTLNPATRLKLLQQVAVLVDQDVPVVPLGTTADTWVMNKPYDIHQDTTSGYLPVYFYTVKLK